MYKNICFDIVGYCNAKCVYCHSGVNAIDKNKNAYTVDVKGSLTSEDPFLWGDKKEVTVNAWYPYVEGSKISDEALTV
jgi:wyosine [tRNA(Phe)-imidazoG37] synthetase (radical SAM superfamily)